MKRILKIVLISFISLLFAFSIYYYWPKKISVDISGVLYQLGQENYDYEINTTISIKGIYDKNLFSRSIFDGKIEIMDDSVYENNDDLTLSIVFNRQKNSDGIFAHLTYFDFPDLEYTTYGTLYMDKNMKQVAILKYSTNDNQSGWYGSNGYMFAAPAKSRAEAVKISKNIIGIEGISW